MIDRILPDRTRGYYPARKKAEKPSAQQRLMEIVKQKPVPSLLAAVAVGAVLGWIVKRR